LYHTRLCGRWYLDDLHVNHFACQNNQLSIFDLYTTLLYSDDSKMLHLGFALCCAASRNSTNVKLTNISIIKCAQTSKPFRSRKPFLAVEASAARTGSDQKLIRQPQCNADDQRILSFPMQRWLRFHNPRNIRIFPWSWHWFPPSTEPLTTCTQ
jgi:hypothetical protein